MCEKMRGLPCADFEVARLAAARRVRDTRRAFAATTKSHGRPPPSIPRRGPRARAARRVRGGRGMRARLNSARLGSVRFGSVKPARFGSFRSSQPLERGSSLHPGARALARLTSRSLAASQRRVTTKSELPNHGGWGPDHPHPRRRRARHRGRFFSAGRHVRRLARSSARVRAPLPPLCLHPGRRRGVSNGRASPRGTSTRPWLAVGGRGEDGRRLGGGGAIFKALDLVPTRATAGTP